MVFFAFCTVLSGLFRASLGFFRVCLVFWGILLVF
jgi:hypothetical protein